MGLLSPCVFAYSKDSKSLPDSHVRRTDELLQRRERCTPRASTSGRAPRIKFLGRCVFAHDLFASVVPTFAPLAGRQYSFPPVFFTQP